MLPAGYPDSGEPVECAAVMMTCMNRTSVVNLTGHRDDTDFAGVVYVGRAVNRGGWRLAASPLANPYRAGRDGSRADVIAAYREYLLARPDLLALLPQLRGRRLGCWCAPLPCHADVIAELADLGAGQSPDGGSGGPELAVCDRG